MGRKYKELKSRLQNQPCRALLLVDDRGLRKNAFKGTQSLLKKIDRREHSLERFFSLDQAIFTNWVNLTFQKTNEEIRNLSKIYQEHAEFFNSVLAEAEIKNISLPRAYKNIELEKQQYDSGCPERRAQIEKIRQNRFEHVSQHMRSHEEDIEDLFDVDFDIDFDLHSDQQHPGSADGAQRLTEIRTMSDEELLRELSDLDTVGDFFTEIMDLCMDYDAMDLLLRVWDLAPVKTKSSLIRSFKKETGESLPLMIESIRKDLGPRAQPRKAESTEKIKTLYRQIVRKIHADVIDEKHQNSTWAKKMWERVQVAYKNNNLSALEHLMALTSLRLQDFTSLSLSDANQMQDLLSSELENLDQTIRGYHKSPAWGFSIKTDQSKIHEKVKCDFEKEKNKIQEAIDDLESRFRFLKLRPEKMRAQQRHRTSSNQRSFFEDEL